MPVCKIYHKETHFAFKAEILGKYVISYYNCPHCNFTQTEQAYWLKESYNNPINITDTGLVQRNLLCSRITRSLIRLFFNKKASYLDMAGGYGLFVRLMRDKGYNFYWKDLYAPNLLSAGFEYASHNPETIELITSFESFEHFDDPLKELEEMFTVSKNIFFSTLLKPTDIPDKDWWYYAFEHGQHISFYSGKTLKFIAEKYHLHFYSNGKDFHLLTEKAISAFKWKFHFFVFKFLHYFCYNSGFTKKDNLFLRNNTP